MTKTILLALSLALGAGSFASPASACGGYRAEDPDVAAVREAVARYTARVGVHPRHWTHTVQVDGDRATAILHIQLDESNAVERPVRLVRRGDEWRVTGIGPRRAVG